MQKVCQTPEHYLVLFNRFIPTLTASVLSVINTSKSSQLRLKDSEVWLRSSYLL